MSIQKINSAKKYTLSSNWKVLLFSFLLFCSSGYSQLNESDIKAAYLLNFIDNLSFENLSDTDSIRVVVIEQVGTFEALKTITAGKTIQGKPVSVSTNKTGPTQLVYIPYTSNTKFKETALDFQTSAVVGDLEHYMTDIRFIKNPDDSFGFELNDKNLKNKKIQASTQLLVYNKSKTEVLSLIEKQQQELENLINQYQNLTNELGDKEKEVSNLNTEISIKESRLLELNEANSLKSDQLTKMQDEIKLKEESLSSINANFKNQKNELDQLKTRLEENYIAISSIADSVEQLQSLLDEQKKLVLANEKLLTEQEQTLTNKQTQLEISDRKANRNLLFLLITGGLILLLIVFLFFFIKENKAKKQALMTIEKQNDSIQAASKQKDEFISNLSHEVRSPLNAIIGYTDLIRNSIKNPETKKNLEYITMSSRNLLGMINDILDYRRIEAGKGKLEFDNFELESVVHVVYNTLKITAENKGLEYKLNYDSTLPQFVRSDSKKVSQILLNLISNAIKFTSDGKVEVKVEKIASSGKNCTVRFSVSDTGIGIDKENQKIIFETFTQETDFTAKEFGGSGLGLSISRKLIELMGSNIIVTSEQGKGAVFSFDLILDIGVENKDADHESSTIEVEGLCDHTILIVDDLKINRTLLTKQFESMGCSENLFFAENGLEALEVISKNNIEIVLTDIRMPVMNGIELTRTLRKNNFKAPIIGVSANNLSSEKDECISVGMNAYIVKPYVFNDLLKEIAICLNLPHAKSQPEPKKKLLPKEFSFERLKSISESEEEFEHLRNEIISDFVSNVQSLSNELKLEFAHENVNKAAYFGDDNLLNLCRELESSIRNADSQTASDLIKLITQTLKDNQIDVG